MEEWRALETSDKYGIKVNETEPVPSVVESGGCERYGLINNIHEDEEVSERTNHPPLEPPHPPPAGCLKGCMQVLEYWSLKNT